VGLLYSLRVDPVIKKFGIIWGARLIFSGASCYWIFQAHEKMGLVGIRDFLKGLLFCGTVILFVKSSDRLLTAAWLSSGSVLVGELFLMVILFSGFLGFVPKLNFYRRKTAGSLKPVFRIGFALLMVQIYYRTDSVILEFMEGEKSVGLYAAMYQLIFVGESIAVLYFASILPRISTFWHADREKLSSLLSFSKSMFVVLGFLSGIVGVLFSREIIHMIYGASYSSSHSAFAILIWSMVMTYTALTPAYFLLGTKYQKECSHATITAALVNLVLNFPLIIYYGIFGAAIATVISKITEFAYVYRKASEKVALGWGIGRALKLAVAVIIALGVGIVNQRYEMTAVLNLILVCSSYLVAILMLRVISIKELKRSMKAIEI
jgi:O-antigen/teichoic acid export membrane protein